MFKVNGRDLKQVKVNGRDLESVSVNHKKIWTRSDHKCENCGRYMKYFRKESIMPTCTETGIDVYKCQTKICISYNQQKRFSTPALGHHYVKIIEIMPGCTTPGRARYRCTRCVANYVEEIPPVGHHYTKVEEKLPTCTEMGYAKYVCTRCRDTYYDLEPALGHSYKVDIIKPATKTEAGLALYTCTRCGYSFTKVIPVATSSIYWKLVGTTLRIRNNEDAEHQGYTKYSTGLLMGDGRLHAQVRNIITETEITLPDNCTGLFENFSSIQEFDVKKYNSYYVRHALGMFEGCSSLIKLNLGTWDLCNVEDAREMFARCTSLTSLTMPATYGMKPDNMRAMFTDCDGLKELDISCIDSTRAWCTEFMFYECKRLEHIYVANTWNLKNCTSSKDMFLNSKKLHNYNPLFVDKTKAIIDNEGYNGGYLEVKELEN